MGKLTSLNGKVVGKIGAVVYSTNAGQIIAREYNPNVANPSTEKQVNQRAKLKLMSQLAATLAPVIVIPKEGLKSSRNLFIKKNMGNAYAENGVAQITYENVQLTNGRAGIPGIVATRSQQSGVSISLEERADAAISRVVYIMYKKTSENTLQYVQSVIAEAAGSAGTFPATLVYCEGDLALFAYGMKDLNSKATAKYDDYSVQNAEDIASLAMERKIAYGDYQFTQTRGATMFADENEIVPVEDGKARVFVTATNGGSVAGAGTFDLDSQVTVTATADEGYDFVGWKRNGSDTILSTSPSYTFNLTGTTDLVAVFRAQGTASEYNITLAKAVTWGSQNDVTVTGGGTIVAGNSCSISTESTNPDLRFKGWFLNNQGTAISTEKNYTFTPNADMNLTARWEGTDEG